MSSIRMSKKLKSDIRGKALNLFVDQINRARNSLAKDYWERGIKIYWENEIKPYLNIVPDSWKVKTTIVDISNNLASNVITLEPPIEIIKISDFTEYRSWASGNNRYKFDIKNYVFNEDYINEYKEYLQRIEKEKNAQDQFMDKLNNYLDKCNTLKQFLNGWPSGEELIPLEVLEEYRKPPTKRIQKTPEEIALPNELNAGLLRTKILQNRK